MTSVTSYYAVLGSESSAPWTTKSDQTYAAIGDGYWRHSDKNDAYEERAKSTISEDSTFDGRPNNLQWEFEFGDDAIIYTQGGNDSGTENGGSPTTRVVFSGKFNYKDNEVKGSLSSITYADWGNSSINGVLSQEEYIKAYTPSETPVQIKDFSEINQIYKNLFYDESFQVAKWDEYPNAESRERFISNIPRLKKQWLQDDWHNDPLNEDVLPSPPNKSEESINEGAPNINILGKPSKFNKKSADKIINFNPSSDTLEIDTDSFDIDSSATFAIGKNKKKVKKKLAKKDFDFLYDQKKGGLYFNENGAAKGFGDGGIIAILKGAPDLTTSNVDFI